jgi:hypothetical protein
MLLSHHQNAGKTHDIKIADRFFFFENVAHFRYLGMTVINQNLIQEEIFYVTSGLPLILGNILK